MCFQRLAEHHGMRHLNFTGVQHLAWDCQEAWIASILDTMIAVAEDGMTYRREMAPNLMRASRLNTNL